MKTTRIGTDGSHYGKRGNKRGWRNRQIRRSLRRKPLTMLKFESFDKSKVDATVRGLRAAGQRGIARYTTHRIIGTIVKDGIECDSYDTRILYVVVWKQSGY